MIMKNNFKTTFGVGYDTADTLIQILQIEARIEALEQACEQKSEGRPFDLMLLSPVFFPEIKKSKPGYDIAQVDEYISGLKDRLRTLELSLR